MIDERVLFWERYYQLVEKPESLKVEHELENEIHIVDNLQHHTKAKKKKKRIKIN
jgi:hypothetical protein